ncbi:MAG: ABC transporter substrate-binding protein [Pseudomonadota bacterium]
MFRHLSAFCLAALFAAPTAAQDRIVVAGGDLTEIVFALGHGDRVVGVDTTSSWPAEAARREQVGYMRRLSAEGVLSLAPDLLIAAPDAGPKSAIDLLMSAEVETAVAPDVRDVDGIASKIAFVAAAIGAGPTGEAAARDYAARLEHARSLVAEMPARPRTLFILSVRDGAPLVGGGETSADEMIREAGGVNVAAGFDGYKPMNAEAIIAAAPEIVLITTAHADRLGGLGEVLARPDVALTPAGKAGRGAVMDALLLLGLGPRTPAAIVELARLLRAPSPTVDRDGDG